MCPLPPLSAPVKSIFGLLIVLCVFVLGCRQPSAQIEIPQPVGAEPTGVEAPSVIVEAPASTPASAGPLLDWRLVDNSLAYLVEGERYRINYDPQHPWFGASTPLVTIVVFYDYQCPYSQRLNEVLSELLRRYPNQLRVVWRQFPLPMHAQAKFASAVALAAHEQGQFGRMHEWLFANNRALSPATVEQQTSDAGMDSQRLRTEVDGDWYAERIAADIAFGQSFDVSATPSFFVNGRPFRGAQPIEVIEAVVLEELQLADRLLAAGSSPTDLWARILAASAADPRPKTPSAAPTPTPAPSPTKRYTMALSGLPERGAKRPKVQILMCGDFDCPYCQRSTATLEQLLKDHKGDLAVSFRHNPLAFHKTARAAHRAAIAAENQGQFWAMFDALYANQRQRSDAEIEDMAKQIGLDMKQFRRDIAAKATETRIDDQAQFCTQDLDARGTPAFYINGLMLSGAQPITAFEQIIQQELAANP